MRLAVVGTGISGLVCARALHRHHEITVFEKDDRLGGHSHTVPVEVNGRVYPVDTGFIVYNERTYPGFARLLRDLGVRTRPTDMSFSVRCERTGLEYASGGPNALLAQRGNLLRPAFQRMVRDVLRFHRDARALLARPDPKLTLGELVEARRYSQEFVDWHLVPLGAAIWSADPSRLQDFPALSFVRFFGNHGLLATRGSLRWRVVRGGSQRYVEQLSAGFRDRIRLSTAVRSIRRLGGSVEVTTARGRERFDEVIVAAHSDEALRLLADPTPAERAVLGSIRYQRNEVVLHTDASLMPRSRRAWASWNYHRLQADQGAAAVTYHMNRLQGLDAPVELCVTLNRHDAIDPARVLRRLTYHHPVFDAAAIRAQGHHHLVSGVNRTHFCGAYWGYGFHEDGVCSARAVLRRFERVA